VFSPLRVFVLVALASITLISYAQDVTTWHNDNNRTGWQQNETNLTPSTVSPSNAFGLLWQWSVSGDVNAQPLAVASVPTTFANCTPSCDLVFIATEEDMLYAFNASPSAQTTSKCPTCNPLVWSLNLASLAGGTAVDCTTWSAAPCNGSGSSPLGRYIGVTGTPVIDLLLYPYILFVVSAVKTSSGVGYYLFAVNVTTGAVEPAATTLIAGSVNGQTPGTKCNSTYPSSGQVSFNSTSSSTSNHIQRSALLLLNGVVYIGFSPYPEASNNGWLFGYQYNSLGTFSQTAVFNSTPYGTGGGIWGSGAGPATDGTFIYTATGNGTFQVQEDFPSELGDSLLKLTSGLVLSDYYTPSNVLTFPPIYPETKPGLCPSDVDFGSGGVLLVPPTYFTYNNANIVVNADKQSNFYVANSANLGKYNPSNNIETVLSPCMTNNGKCKVLNTGQGYWASPAFWNDGTNSWLFFSATDQTLGDAPYPINGYLLSASATPPPIPQVPNDTTTAGQQPVGFCYPSPTPSVSSNVTVSGTAIVWAIENAKSDNPAGEGPDCLGTTNSAVLHAFNASTLAQIYTSNTVTTLIGTATRLVTPTIFKGQVYMETTTAYAQYSNLPAVDVFGLCDTTQSGNCMP
jgi:hypothetical protein